MNATAYEPINLGLILCDQSPEIFGLIAGYGPHNRDLELIRLGSIVPVNCSGYVTQLAKGSRSVRLDAARQLQRAGVVFGISIPGE